MKKRDSALVLTLCFQLGGCFACDPPEGFECTQNSDCEGGGHVCIEAECYEVCTLQIHCDAGMFCSQDGLCVVEETGGDGPVINSVSGNDPSDATRVIDGLVVTGERLANAALEVRGDKGQFGLSVRTVSDQRVEAVFPPNILDGRYTLVAVNGAGEDQAAVELTLPWLTAEDLVERINESSNKLSTSVLHVGTTSDDVAAGDHDHAGAYAPASHDHPDLVQASDARLTDARAPTAGSPDYIQNQAGSHQDASFDISGDGRFGGNANVGGTVTIGGKYVLVASQDGLVHYAAPDGNSYVLNPACGTDVWCCTLPSNAICAYNHGDQTRDDVLELSLVGANSNTCIVASRETDIARRIYYGTDDGNDCHSGEPCLQLREVGNTDGPIDPGISFAIICF